MTTPSSPKRIVFRREDRDYDAYYGEEYLGSYATHHAAEVVADGHALDLLEQGLIDTVEGITTMQWQPSNDGPIARWREQGAAEQARIAALFCPDCGASMGEICSVCGWTARPLVLARPGGGRRR